LKPLKGCDPYLPMNLETFFNLDYPKFELIFCIQDYDDPAIEVVRNLLNKYPQVDAQLILGGSNVGTNPKVNNMNPGYEKAKYDLIWISDDKMYIQPDTLLDMVDCLDQKDVVIVNQMPYFKERPGMSAFFEKIYFCCAGIPHLFIMRLIAYDKCLGMSSLFEKKIVDSAGGLKYFSDTLSEDFKMIEYAHKMGYKMAYSRKIGLQNHFDSSIEFQSKRLLRWLRCLNENFLFLEISPFIW
jgi:ceramide glucosyltransferase